MSEAKSIAIHDQNWEWLKELPQWKRVAKIMLLGPSEEDREFVRDVFRIVAVEIANRRKEASDER